MNQFATTAEAKEYLVNSILAEASRRAIPLSEAERQLLRFSEAFSEFDPGVDQSAYEQKIAALIRSLRKEAKVSNREEFNTWTEAAQAIAKEDHYLLVLMAAAGEEPRPPHDRWKLLATALLIVGVLVAIMLLKAGVL